MPIRRDLYEQLITDREREAVEAERESRRTWAVALAVCMAWCVLGAAVTVTGFTVRGEQLARALIDLGQGIAAAGVLGTVLYTYRRRERRGYE
ncbi:MAG TPA: hypothetical protein VFX98_15725 [Longimicrobiaceae bacterium]|nr:hypothetical protein [Longimicrobiaceae bacterium]